MKPAPASKFVKVVVSETASKAIQPVNGKNMNC